MPDSSDPKPLDFTRADFSPQASGDSSQASGNSVPVCGACTAAIAGSYYTLGDQMLCEPCHFAVRDAGAPGSVLSRAFGALGLGVVAAMVAGALWLLVTELTGYEIGLIAIVVGFLVGAAVRIGGRAVGGVGYQLLAVFLTYSAIVMTYVPTIVSELRANEELIAQLESETTDPSRLNISTEGDVTPAVDEWAITITLYLVSVPFAYAAPFLLGLENAIGLLIIGFALFQAGKMNKTALLEMQGPFRLGGDAAPIG
jgi:phosphate/sulfate permease